VYREKQLQESLENKLQGKNLTGSTIVHPVKSYLMILDSTDLTHLLSLSISGVSVQEILHTARLKSNGNVKSYQEMKLLLENVSGITGI